MNSDDLRITSLSPTASDGSTQGLMSCSQSAAAGDRWLLMAVLGHLGGTGAVRVGSPGRRARTCAEAADLIWNRAALEHGGTTPGIGDRAQADVLAFHGLVMSGGMLDAVERTPAGDRARIEAAFRWFGLDAVAEPAGFHARNDG